MNEPTDNVATYVSTKRVLAGRITEVVPYGCYVEGVDGASVLREFPPNMTARYTPAPGDWWIVYPDGYQSLSPAAAFEDGYLILGIGEVAATGPTAP